MHYHIPLMQQLSDPKLWCLFWPTIFVLTITIWMLAVIGAITVIQWWFIS